MSAAFLFGKVRGVASASEPIRIAFCITDLDAGGAERALVQLVTRLDRRRWQPAVYCLSPGGVLVEELINSGIPVVCLGARSVWNIGVLFRLTRELRQLQPALLQTFLFHANIVGRIAGWRAGVPYIVSGIRVAEKRTRTHLWLDRVTERLVDRHVCVSQGVADFSARVARLSPEKLHIIPNGVDACLFADAQPCDLAPLGIPPGNRTLITVGRLDPQKGLQFLIEAMETVVAQDRNIHLLIVGEGPQRPILEQDIRDRQLGQHVHLLGQRSDVPQLLQACDAFVLPSLWEGMPNAVLEAMAAGLPVIATRVEGVSELVTDGETGLLVDSGSATSLATAITMLLRDTDRAREMGTAAQRRTRSEFSWEKMTAAYERLYESLLATL